MARLLEAQKGPDITTVADDYEGFGLYVIERMLEIYQSELTPSERMELRNIAVEWTALCEDEKGDFVRSHD